MNVRLLISVALFLISLLAFPASTAFAATAPVLISEVQTGSSAGASDEFIELYNNSELTIDLSEYTIEYYSASATAFLPLGSPTQTLHLSGNLYPKGYFLATSTGYLSATSNLAFSATLADGGGTLRLVRSGSSTEDVLGWGTAKLYETAAHTKPGNGKSLSRVSVDEGILVDTNNNQQDFELLTIPTPSNINIAPPITDPEPTEPEPVPDPDPTPEPAPETPPVVVPTANSLPLAITEILPNPASPATDEDDEYIELYNPNDHEVQLSGYRLETGNSFSYKYTFSGGTIPAFGYVVLYSKDSNLTLSNTSGAAHLLDPNGVVISEITDYEDADDGSAWALIGGTWQWTLTPTPGGGNVLRLPLIPAAKISSSVAKAKTTKAATAAKPKAAAKTASAKAAVKSKAASSANKSQDELAPPDAMHPSVLVGVGCLALLYAAYEYRGDIRSLIAKFQRNRELRRSSS